jgi:hypothetical protein
MKNLHPTALLFLSFFAFQTAEVFAIDSVSDRAAIVYPRTKKFFKSNSAKQWLSLGGNRTSTEDSRTSQLTTRYSYQSYSFINELNFLNENRYANLGSTPGKRYLVKKSELYDFSISSKARLFGSENYATSYHRTIYDDLSKYYRDSMTAIGFGRMFLNDKIEFDTSIGYHDVLAYGYEVNVIPSIRINFKITDRLTFNQRGYWFIDHESTDNQLKTSLIYRVGPKLSFEIRHNFDQRRYEDDAKREVVNQESKSITIGLVFDLE